MVRPWLAAGTHGNTLDDARPHQVMTPAGCSILRITWCRRRACLLDTGQNVAV